MLALRVIAVSTREMGPFAGQKDTLIPRKAGEPHTAWCRSLLDRLDGFTGRKPLNSWFALLKAPGPF